GAFPPMIGWAAVTGGVSVESFVLFLLIFMWTPPHFWALSLYRCGDYAAAGVPMLPVVAGKRETRRQILIYSVLLAPIGMAPTLLGYAGWIYGAAAALLGLLFVVAAIAVWHDSSDRSARRMFGYSIFYLFALFALLIADRAPVLAS
ncbi:MAG: UbiA family prenyltransferase, partial [Alphaproteobacteria bacterium]|nr:UbiA family prenyltransferase [Alphaproteobacteria bacterium]